MLDATKLIDAINTECRNHGNHFVFRQIPIEAGYANDIMITTYMENDRKSPYMYMDSNDYKGRHIAHFAYGYDYARHMPYNTERRPKSETSFDMNKSYNQIARQILKMWNNCYEYFLENVKPRKDSDDAYINNNFEKLSKIASIIGVKAPERGADRISGTYKTGPYATDIRSCSKGYDFLLNDVPEELTIKILEMIYNNV